MKLSACLFTVFLAFARAWAVESPSQTNDYTAVDALFAKHCLDCHAAQEPDGKLVLESFETLMSGGEHGPAIMPGKSAESRLVQMLEGRVEGKDGKKLIMPPGTKRKKLEPAEIAVVKSWIDSGARPPAETKPSSFALVTPKITPKNPPVRAIKAVAFAPATKLLAVARPGEVELRSVTTREVLKTLGGQRGSVNALVFSRDGTQLFAAAGEPSLFGEVRQWNIIDGTLIRTFEGHKDALYSVALSPDDKTLATGSYDQKIKLWDVADGREIKTLSGHNGGVFDLAFRPDGKILASASGDRTVKLWDVASGARRDTLAQSLKEVYSIVFSADGQRLFAGGVDNRIRVWQISDKADETTNPLLEAKFAHEGAILKLALSTDGKTLLSAADDRTVKLWDAANVTEKILLEKQPDWPPALTFAADNKDVVVGRLDGTLGFYDAITGKPSTPPKPELIRAEPRGLQRGVSTTVKLIGANLGALTDVKFHHGKFSGELLREPPASASNAWLRVMAAADLERGSYELSVANVNGESGRIKLHVDDLAQVIEGNRANAPAERIPSALPVSFWSTIEQAGEKKQFEFNASAGHTIVFDLAGKSLDSKIKAAVTLFDARGKQLAASSGFDDGDPLFAFKIPQDGRYTVRVADRLLGGSADHFFRLSVGEFAYVTDFFPLSVSASRENQIRLIGFNLPEPASVAVQAGASGELELPIDANKFRTRRSLKAVVSEMAEFIEIEPNDSPATAMKLHVPCAVNGRIASPAESQSNDEDFFRFEAKAGEQLVIETQASQRGSPIDTKIEVLHGDGKPVQRLQLQAVRNSAVTFRGIDSNSTDVRVENWEEMELNQFLYLQGEVVKLFRAPQGPDSGFQFYSLNGKRRNYFDTSATAHANEEPCYIVEPHPVGAKLVANGLPVFPVYFANDDDAERKLGSDSRVHFTAPADGSYLVRVTDNRGHSGERFVYRLIVRAPKPDFKVTLNGANPTVPVGSGQSFSVNVERMDGFEGEVEVTITGLPPGFSASTPLVIEAGHSSAAGTLNASLDAPATTEANWGKSEVIASAMIKGRKIAENVNDFGTIKLGERPKLFVFLDAAPGTTSTSAGSTNVTNPLELTIAPGQTIPAWIKVRRNGHDDLITFSVDNLPHGIIVDNIGLNGVLMPKGEYERQIFLAAARWVPETDRFCFAVENQAGRQTSLPVMLHVRKAAPTQSARAK